MTIKMAMFAFLYVLALWAVYRRAYERAFMRGMTIGVRYTLDQMKGRNENV